MILSYFEPLKSLWMWYYDEDMVLQVWCSCHEDVRPSGEQSLSEIRKLMGGANELLYDSGDA